MPSVSEKQRKFMGAELSRKRAGKKTVTGMSEGQLEDFASKPLTKSGQEGKLVSWLGAEHRARDSKEKWERDYPNQPAQLCHSN